MNLQRRQREHVKALSMPTTRRILTAFQSLTPQAQHDTLLLLSKSMDELMAYTAILVRCVNARCYRSSNPSTFDGLSSPFVMNYLHRLDKRK